MGCVYVMQSRQLSQNIANFSPTSSGRLIKLGSAACLLNRVDTLRGGQFARAHVGQRDWKVWRHREVDGDRWRWETLELRMHFALRDHRTLGNKQLREHIGDFDPHTGVRTELFLLPTAFDVAIIEQWFDGLGSDLSEDYGLAELEPLPPPNTNWYPGCGGRY